MADSPVRATRTPRWWILALVVVIAAIVAATVIGAPSRHAHLTTTVADPDELPEPPEADSSFPRQLERAWEAPSSAAVDHNDTFVIDGLVVGSEPHRVFAIDPATGSERWSYHRSDAELCALSVGFSSVIASFSSGFGCGETTAITARTGAYSATRASLIPGPVHSVRSNNAVGVYNDTMASLWRSDLVRTIALGPDPAPQEPGQINTGLCRLRSVLTRVDNVALIDVCPAADNPSKEVASLHFYDRNPEDSRLPEQIHSVELDAPGASLVAVGQDAAAVYYPPAHGEDRGRLVSYNTEGAQLAAKRIPPLGDLSQIIRADLPHHITVATGAGLLLLHPDTLEVQHLFRDARGSGVALGENSVAYPVADGLQLARWDTGEPTEHITAALYDPSLPGLANLRIAGEYLAVQQADRVSGWRRNANEER